MTIAENQHWEEKLDEACFPVTLTEVYTGTKPRQAKRYRAIVPLDTDSEPLAIVTDRYRLVRNEDVIDLGYEAFERLFGLHRKNQMAVFNVVMTKTRGSFLADFTTPELDCEIPIPIQSGAASKLEEHRHVFFLRVMNSYNKTRAVRIEVGICRWICRNLMIFDKQSIQLRTPHHKTKQQLMDQIAQEAKRLETSALSRQISTAYSTPLAPSMDVLEGVWQTLRLAIPPVKQDDRSARLWEKRCATLSDRAYVYEEQHGKTAFSVLQAASQWAREQAQMLPIQRNSYERRCGEILEYLTVHQRWPDRDRSAHEQMERIRAWSNVTLPSDDAPHPVRRSRD